MHTRFNATMRHEKDISFLVCVATSLADAKEFAGIALKRKWTQLLVSRPWLVDALAAANNGGALPDPLDQRYGVGEYRRHPWSAYNPKELRIDSHLVEMDAEDSLAVTRALSVRMPFLPPRAAKPRAKSDRSVSCIISTMESVAGCAVVMEPKLDGWRYGP